MTRELTLAQHLLLPLGVHGGDGRIGAQPGPLGRGLRCGAALTLQRGLERRLCAARSRHRVCTSRPFISRRPGDCTTQRLTLSISVRCGFASDR